MEALKGNTLSSIFKSMEILAEFPNQARVLKSTRIISQLKGRRCGMTRRMIDKAQTGRFADWLHGLARAKAGDIDLQRQLLEAGKEADAHLNRMLDGVQTYAKNLQEASKHYTQTELRTLRKHEPITDELFDKITKNILEMAAFLFETHPSIKELPPASEYAKAQSVIVRWMADGEQLMHS